MQLRINGEQEELEKSISLLEYLEKINLNSNAVVAELNAKIIPHEKFAMTYLQENDSLELLHFVGGG